MLYDEVLEALKDEITQSEYNRYIKNLKVDENASKSDIVVFITQNKILENWINTKYSKKLQHIIELKTGVKPQIKIISQSFSHQSTNKAEKREKIPQNQPQSKLNPSYTFEHFVVGSSNQVAYAISKSICENQAKLYNPLFIYGFSGLGKTHLLHAIGNEVVSMGKTILYTTSEEFMNAFTESIRKKTTDRFRQKYRECDYLLIDDIQFLSGKVETQVEFFNTFNALHSDNKQIVLTSDKPPKKIAGIEERLLSRFEWGMLVDIQPPELETKISIIKTKCEQNSINLDDEIINYIATNMGENIREIESAIITLNGYASITNQDITIEFAMDVMKDIVKEKRKNITLEQIIKVISKELNVKPSDIKSKKRSKNIVEARRIGIYLARTLTPNSMPSLAQYFGMKDHTAVSHNMKKINQLINENENFKLRIDELKNIITYSQKD